MTYQPSSSLGGLLIALVLLMLLAVLGLGAGLFLTVRAPAAAPAGTTSPGSAGAAPAVARATHVSYQVQPQSCVRLPSGDCRVVLTLVQTGEGAIHEFELKVTAGATQCALESAPLTAPFPLQADVVVRVPKDAVGEESTSLQISTTTRGRFGYFGKFQSSRSSSVQIPTPENAKALTVESP